MINFAKAFGKDTGFAIGLLLLSVIFMCILAFGDAKYQLGGAPATAAATPADPNAPATPVAPAAPAPKPEDPWVSGQQPQQPQAPQA